MKKVFLWIITGLILSTTTMALGQNSPATAATSLGQNGPQWSVGIQGGLVFPDKFKLTDTASPVVDVAEMKANNGWLLGIKAGWTPHFTKQYLSMQLEYAHVFGPNADMRLGRNARLQADARGIFRTAGDWSLSTGDFGYRARAEVVFGGRDENLGVGVRGYDLVSSIEPWPLKDFEVGWSTFLFHRDYRDYFRRRGASLFTTVRATRQLSLTLEGRSENEASALAREVFTLFQSGRTFRPNVRINDGHYDVVTGSVRYDTRNDLAAPTAGVLLNAEWEWGHGSGVAPCALPGAACLAAFPAGMGTALSYDRLFFDLRSYTRLSPSGRLNLRLAGGGWAGGDPLPLQRRVGLGYPDPLPGYGFGQFNCGGEMVPGTPAL